jgi:hypothetical protein
VSPRPPSAARAVSPLALGGALLLCGCSGVSSPDLFLVQRSGQGPHARLTLRVTEEGGVHCNGGPTLKLSDAQLVQARGIQEDLHDPAASHMSLAPRPGSVLSFSVRDADGSVRFSDNSAGQPKVLRELVLFVLRVAQQVCHLPE